MNKDFNENDELNMDLDLEALYKEAMPAPDLWNRIETGIAAGQGTAQVEARPAENTQSQAQIVDLEAARKRKARKKTIGILAAAAVMLLIAIPTVILTSGKRDKQETKEDVDQSLSIEMSKDAVNGVADEKKKDSSLHFFAGAGDVPEANEEAPMTEAAVEETDDAEDVQEAPAAVQETEEKEAEATTQSAMQEDRSAEISGAERTEDMFEGELVFEGGAYYAENVKTPLTYDSYYELDRFRVTNPEALEPFELEEGKRYKVWLVPEEIDRDNKTLKIKAIREENDLFGF